LFQWSSEACISQTTSTIQKVMIVGRNF
jgi:hypothetical protein